jgi:hypothetical protein
MKKGIVMFAHNNRQVDYAKMSIISAKLAKKNLQVPVSLITDTSTVDWMHESNIFKMASEVFENIIITDRPEDENSRITYDGKNKTKTPFKNANRNTVWDLTPYERTLLIDTDYFVLSNSLNEYWDVDSDMLIAESYNDIVGKERTGYLDKHVSETGIKMLWATTVMFTKNENTKLFFNLVEHVRKNYKQFADLFRFNDIIYRNDISFSVARHIMYGYETDNDYSLPSVLSVTDKDYLHDVDKDKNLIVMVSPKSDGNYCVTKVNKTDLHIMNKQSIIRNSDKLMELA